jgi:ABC-2 type transport system permease protein
MIKVVRLFGVLFSLSLRRTVTFRADLVFELGVTLVGTSSAIAALSVVYTRTDSLAGWSSGQALTLLGTFQLVSGLRAAFVEPNVGWLGEQVKNGRFDALLLQPAPTIFLATLGTAAPLALIHVVLGGGIVAFSIVNSAAAVTLTGVLAWLALLIASTAIMWATRTLFAAIVFWAFGLSLDVVYDALWQFGRYPVQIYRPPLQLLFTYVFPVALISTVPVAALTDGGQVGSVSVAIGTATAACLTAVLVWRAALRRYTSATS